MTGATDGPVDFARMRHMETLNEYMTRRTALRAELLAGDGDEDFVVLVALGKAGSIASPPKTMLYSAGFMTKRQAE